jgi:hydroxymethylglutaryl-CoA reductase (NADPH)
MILVYWCVYIHALMTNFYITGNHLSEKEKLKQRQDLLRKRGATIDILGKIHKFDPELVGQKNCENLIGGVELPIGLAGPVKVDYQDDFQQFNGEFLLPLATTEGALVASVARGCKVLTATNNLQVTVKKVGMTRAPVFGFGSHREAIKFVEWLRLEKTFKKIKKEAESTSHHLKLKKFQTWVVGRAAYVRFVADTDAAMGMNMITIALRQVWEKVIKKYPQIELISISGNMCADKKTSAVNRLWGRGYRVTAEAKLSKQVVQKILKTSTAKLTQTYFWKNQIGSNLAGSSSHNMQAANMVAAMFLATGQDLAHTAETSQAETILETQGKSLYVAVVMPNVNVGVVGGGTSLPAFKQARQLILNKELSSSELAGAVGVAVLAGELSGLAALSSHTLAQAHHQLAR